MLSAFKFSTRSLEEEYQAELGSEKIRLTRILAVLAFVLNFCFVALDFWAIPSALTQVWMIRGLIGVTLTLAFLSTWLPAFSRLYPYVILFVFGAMGSGINAMIFLAQETDVAIEVYYGGLILIIMGIFTLTYVSPVLSAGLAFALTAAYALIVFGAQAPAEAADQVRITAHLFFFVSTTVIGIVAQGLRDRYSRENYLLRHSLERDVEIKDEERRRASYLAEHDPLTGLANRLRMERDLNALMDHARQHHHHVVVMFVDLDGFKPVNDDHGHAAGDRVLKVIAERLRRCVRAEDVVARIGGDEFVVGMLMPSADGFAAGMCAEKVAHAVDDDIHLRGARLRLSACIGVARYPEDGDDLDALLRVADEQMYRVKNAGKGGIALTRACQPHSMAG